MTAEQERTLLQLISIGLPQANAAESVDVSKHAFGMRKLRDKVFLTAVQKARAKGMLSRIAMILQSKDWRAHAWYLERQFPEEFSLARAEARVSPPPAAAAASDTKQTTERDMWDTAIDTVPGFRKPTAPPPAAESSSPKPPDGESLTTNPSDEVAP